MAISPARIAAFAVLLRVETQDAYAAELLHSESISRLDPRDRNLAMQIVMGTLRWQSRLDAELSQFASGKNEMSRLDAEVRTALRMAAFQLRHLDRIPVSAAVNDSVELVKRARKRSAAPLVNAVLRKLAAAPKPEAAKLDSAETLARDLAHPLWLVERWAAEFGLETATRISEADQELPVSCLRMPPDKEQASAVEAELRAAEIEFAAGEIMSSARRIVSGDVTATAAYRERRIAIQDEASQLVAALVGRGEHILDCCAAPGGKTQAIATRNPSAEVVAVELHPQRARMMREFVTASNVKVIEADIATLATNEHFDLVLADVPCSGTGTLARNPEIKWRLKPDDLADLHRRQVAILAAALDHAEKGARVVYSTCSLEPEENEQVIEEVLRERKDVRLMDAKKVLSELRENGELAWRDTDSITRGPFLRTMPGVHPCDGFFAAVMEKVSE